MIQNTDVAMTFTRPLIAGALAGAYGYYNNGTVQLPNMLLVGGSVFAGEACSNIVLQGLSGFSSNKSIKSMEQMMVAPVLSGLCYAGAFRYYYPAGYEQNGFMFTFGVGAAADIASERLSVPLKAALSPEVKHSYY